MERDSLKYLNPHNMPIVVIWVLCGLLWAACVYLDLDNTIRVPCVILLVVLAFIAGSQKPT